MNYSLHNFVFTLTTFCIVCVIPACEDSTDIVRFSVDVPYGIWKSNEEWSITLASLEGGDEWQLCFEGKCSGGAIEVVDNEVRLLNFVSSPLGQKLLYNELRITSTIDETTSYYHWHRNIFSKDWGVDCQAFACHHIGDADGYDIVFFTEDFGKPLPNLESDFATQSIVQN